MTDQAYFIDSVGDSLDKIYLQTPDGLQEVYAAELAQFRKLAALVQKPDGTDGELAKMAQKYLDQLPPCDCWMGMGLGSAEHFDDCERYKVQRALDHVRELTEEVKSRPMKY